MSDKRAHHPFGFSRLGPLAHCPGRHGMEALHGRPPESEIAASGTRIHAAAAGEQVELEGDEGEVAEKIRAYVLHRFEGADWTSAEAALSLFDYERSDPEEEEPLTAGYLDHMALWFKTKRAVIVETKTGYLEHVDFLKWQLWGQAAALLQNHPVIDKVEVYGYNPRIRGG